MLFSEITCSYQVSNKSFGIVSDLHVYENVISVSKADTTVCKTSGIKADITCIMSVKKIFTCIYTRIIMSTTIDQVNGGIITKCNRLSIYLVMYIYITILYLYKVIIMLLMNKLVKCSCTNVYRYTHQFILLSCLHAWHFFYVCEHNNVLHAFNIYKWLYTLFH